MQDFIGVKTVMAEPAKRNGEDGYRVIYPEGYESWSPKRTFETAYLPLNDPTRITPTEVERFLGKVETQKIDDKTTLVKSEGPTGFREYSTSSCVDPANYNESVGREIGANRIKDTLWLCLGFVLQWGRNGLKEVGK